MIRQSVNDNFSLPLPFPASTAIAIGDLLWWDTVNLVCKPAAVYPPGATEQADQGTFAPLFVGVAADVRLASEADNKGIRTVIVQGVFDADVVAGYTPKLGDLVSVTRNGTGNLVSQMVTNATVTAASAIGKVINLVTQSPNSQPWGTVQTKVRVFFNGRLTDFP